MNKNEKLNILAASDIHGNTGVYKWIADRVSESDIDLIILAGDLTGFCARHSEVEIKRILASAGRPVLFIMGNMDRREWKSEPPFVNISGIRYIFKEVPFTGYQYTIPFAGGNFEKNEDEQRSDLEKLSPLVDNKTVLVTHGPCYGFLDETGRGRHAGSRSLGSFCTERNPKYHIFGHIHENCGVLKNHFNVSYPRMKAVLKLEYYSGEYEMIIAGPEKYGRGDGRTEIKST